MELAAITGRKFFALADVFDAPSEKGQPAPDLLDELIELARHIESTESQITSRDWL
jgi:hypothetical protein